MIKRPAIILLIVLALAVGSYYIIKYRSDKAVESTPSATPSMLLQEDEHGNLTLLEIVDNSSGYLIRLKRFSDGTWIITEPYEGAASQGDVTAAETQLFALKLLSSLETAADFTVMGLSTPSFIITLQFEDDYKQTLLIGDKTPTSSGYYVQMNDKVHVIGTYSIDAVISLVNNPPYLATATPTLEPPTATPSPEVTHSVETVTTTPTQKP